METVNKFPRVMRTLFIACMILLTGTAAHAQEWPRLADGRTVVTVRDVAIAFPSQGSDLTTITFMTTNLATNMKLAEVISFPEKARRYFTKKHDYFRITIPNGRNLTDLFLNRFDRNALYGLEFSVDFNQNNCRSWSSIYEKDRTQLAASHMPVDADGWAGFYFEKSPPTWHYIRAHDLPDVPRHFDSFVCDWAHQCTSTTCVGAKAAFTYRFDLVLHRRERWSDLVLRAGEVFHYLFDVNNAPASSAQ